ncbi:MAG: hypothetical protein IJ201_09140 [Solobacterium sp.]|nr:hypothetical protein [Solobacterium sp.]
MSYIRLFVFLAVLILNLLTVKTSDDLGYSISNGLFDLFQREYVQYMTWTGRTVAHLIARFFLAMPKLIFDVCNSIMFCVLVDLMCRHAVGPNRDVAGPLYAVTALAVFLFAPLFGQTVLWETGSCNYLWTTTIILAFLYVYRKELDGTSERKPWFAVLFFLFGIAAGWTNENTGGACILLVLIFFVLYRRKKMPVKPWMIAGLIGSVIGFVLMIKAPGNAIRAQDFINEGGKAYVLVHDLRNTLNIFGKPEAQLPLLLAFGAGLALRLTKGIRREDLILALGYALSGMAAVCAIILSPVPVEFDRSMFGATILVIVGVLSIAAPLFGAQKTEVHWSLPALLGVMCVISLVQYGHALLDLGYTRYQYTVREKWVTAQKNAGNLNPVIPTINNEFFTTYNAMYGLNDILDYPSFVNNENYAITHGLESVVSTSLDKWNAIYRNGDPALMNVVDLERYLAAVKANPDYIGFVTTTALNERYEAYLDLLETAVGKNLGTHSNYILEFGAETDVNGAEESFGKEYTPDGHYVWVYSSDDPMTSDILIDGMECTNDLEGVTIAIFDRASGTVMDAVTWNTDYAMRGIRSYVEK